MEWMSYDMAWRAGAGLGNSVFFGSLEAVLGATVSPGLISERWIKEYTAWVGHFSTQPWP